MCFNKETSWGSWLVISTIAWYLYKRNKGVDRWMAIFIGVFSLIQLLEGFVWAGIDTNRPQINANATALIIIAIWLQPLVQSYMGYLYTSSSILYWFSLIFVVMLLWAIYRFFTEDFYSVPGPNGHLVWKSSEKGAIINGKRWLLVPYLVGLFLPLIYLKTSQSIPLLVIGLGTLYWSQKYYKDGEFSSMWCFSALLYAMVTLMIY
jgi:hypothetical protein